MTDDTKVNVVNVLAEIVGKGRVVVFKNTDGEWYLRDSNGGESVLAQAGGDGADGTNGWTPEVAVVSDNERRVLQVVDYFGGSGSEPASPKYVGAGGLVDAIEDAVDIRGATGATGLQGVAGADGADGADGTNGTNGSDGSDGDRGWSPVFAVATDGNRRVLQLVDYVGGEGSTPTDNIDEYVGAAGMTATIGDAVDIRGATGATGASGSGSGDVVGPGGTTTEGALVVFDTTDGTGIREIAGGDAAAARTALGAAAASHTHAQSDITDLTSDLAAKQPLDTDLTAIAALTSAANKMLYATGAGTWALADLTAAGRALLDDADASAQRTTLGLAIGSNVQAYDATLAGIAGLTPTADRMIYWNGSTVLALAPITSFARSILDDTDASAVRSTISAAAASHTHAQSDITDLTSDLALKAPLASPALTGTPTAPTAADATNTTQIATTAYVTTKVGGLSAVYQPLDATLTALAAVITSADALIYATGSDTFSTTTLTSAARGLLDDTTVSAMRTTLELALADVTAIRANTADRVPYFDDMVAAAAYVALTDGANIAWDMSTAWPNVSVTLGGNRQFSNPTSVKAGTGGVMAITQDATGSRVPTWASNFKNTAAVTLSTGAGKTDLVGWYAHSSTVIVIFPIAYDI